MTYPSRVLVIDVETTGLNPIHDYIVQVGAAVMDGGDVIGVPFNSRIQPNLAKLKVSLEALQVQCGKIDTAEGIANVSEWFARLHKDPASKEVAEKFSKWCIANDAKNLPNVAQNASFDYGFIAQWIFQQRTAFGNKSPLSPIWIDTKAMAQFCLQLPSYSLDPLCEYLGVEARDACHDAVSDVIATGRVYDKLRGRL
jgi:DNA polymerase-3 subunit alpha (Gram-positive type)